MTSSYYVPTRERPSSPSGPDVTSFRAGWREDERGVPRGRPRCRKRARGARALRGRTDVAGGDPSLPEHGCTAARRVALGRPADTIRDQGRAGEGRPRGARRGRRDRYLGRGLRASGPGRGAGLEPLPPPRSAYGGPGRRGLRDRFETGEI